MGLKAKLENDLRDALRNKDEPRKAALRLALAAIKNAEISKRGELDENDLIGVLSKEAKLRHESASSFAQGGREDLVAQEEAALRIIEEYLPAQMSDADIAERAREVIAQVGATSLAQMGDVMRVLMPELKGKADGQVVSETVKAILGQAG